MSKFRLKKGAAIIAASALALSLGGQVGTAEAAKAKKAFVVKPISAEDKQLGADEHPNLLETYGGALTGAQATYVETVGKNIAVQTGLSNARSDYTVTLLNSSVNNAFAIPGGYIYVTRQLTALMNNEAELAGVLAHEVSHVSLRHAKRRAKAARNNTLAGAGLAILSGLALGTEGIGGLLQRGFLQGSQLLTLRYSRSQELEADNSGISYLRKAGYDPSAMASVLQSLANQNALEARLMGSNARVPEWASTHPDPASRVLTAQGLAGAGATGTTNREAFLRSINGIIYGDDPKQGIVDGVKFAHPELRFAFQAPQGFYLMNGANAVSIGGQAGRGKFSQGPYSGDLDAYVKSVFAAVSKDLKQELAPAAVSRTTVNGLPAAYGVVTVPNEGDMVVYAYEFSKTQAFFFLTMAQTGQANVFAPMYQSMRRLTAAEAANVRARKLVVITTKTGDTLQSLADRMAYSDAPMDRFLVLNRLPAGSAITPGMKIKLVTY